MSSALDVLPAQARVTISRVLGTTNLVLLKVLESRPVPSRNERVEVETLLGLEFMLHLDTEHEATEEGRRVDDAIGEFLMAWPIEWDE